jgi:hypothetical protein
MQIDEVFRTFVYMSELNIFVFVIYIITFSTMQTLSVR